MTTRSGSALFAMAAHAAVGQKRKYTGEPYHTHPAAVRAILEQYVPDATEAMLQAADLHDVIEDTQVPLEMIWDVFGSDVAYYVDGLTAKSKPEDGNRAERKAMDLIDIAKTCPETKTIKLADLIHNSESILAGDANFAKVYMKEKRLLLDFALKEGDTLLWNWADVIVTEYEQGILQRKLEKMGEQYD